MRIAEQVSGALKTRIVKALTPSQYEFSMPRLLLSDEHWSKLRKILRQMAIYDKPDLRLTVEGILYRMRVGCPWRDLPEAFGCWNSIYKHFNAWSAAGKWVNLFKALVVEPDREWIFIDGSYAKAHQHSSGAASNADEAIGKSRAGIPARFIWWWMLMAFLLILKSLGDTSMIAQ